MKEPILSLDEIRSLWLKSTGIEEPCCEWDVLGFAAALESAILEKLCGEPVAWRYPYRGKYAFYGIGDTVSSDSIEDSEPLYAINRSKA